MNPVLMMIGDVLANEPAQMGFIQRNDVIEKFPTAASDPSFGSPILPGRLDSSSLYFEPGRLQEVRNASIELRVVIENNVAAAHGIRESLAELLQSPLSGGITGHVVPKNLWGQRAPCAGLPIEPSTECGSALAVMSN